MPQYLAPGVYIEEKPGAKPFQAVGTATGGFIGIAERGPIGKATLITNWTQFTDTFGGFIPSGYLAYAVNQFFTEGGTKCWVIRTCHYSYDVMPAKHQADTGSFTLQDTEKANTLKVEAMTPGSWSDHVWIEIADAKKEPTNKFRMVVWYKGVEVEAYEELTKGDVVGKVKAASKYITVSDETASLKAPACSAWKVNDRGNDPQPTLGITALDAAVSVSILSQANDKFGILVLRAGVRVEKFLNLTLADMAQKVNGVSAFIRVNDLNSKNKAPNNLPVPSATILNDRAASPQPTLAVTALKPGLTTSVIAEGTDANTFQIAVYNALETVDNLTVGNAGNAGNADGEINGTSPNIIVVDLNSSSSTSDAKNLPAEIVSQSVPFATILTNRANPSKPTLAVAALKPGLSIDIFNGTETNTFKITVKDPNETLVETIDDLTVGNAGNAEGKINGKSPNIIVVDLNSSSSTSDAENLPAEIKRQSVPSATILNDRAASPQPTLAVAALKPDMSIGIAEGTDVGTFQITVYNALETVDNLTIEDAESKINGTSPNIVVADLASPTLAPSNRPAVTTAMNLTTPPSALHFFLLTGGDDGLGDGVTLQDTDKNNSLSVFSYREGVQVKISDAQSGVANQFKLSVGIGGSEVEPFNNLIMDEVENTINGSSQYIEVVAKQATAGGGMANRPANTLTTDGKPSWVPVPTGLADMDFIGDSATQNGLHAFDVVDDVNILAIPDRPGDRDVIILAYTYCQNRKDCFFVADPLFGLDPQGVLAFKDGTGEHAGNAFNSSFAAMYYPWVLTSDPLTGGSKFVPPSGAVVGTYSCTDVVRGVHKAPAGTIDGYLNSTSGIERIVTKGEQELLNPENINVIRSFPGIGIVVWGARTLSTDAEWRYVNIRRLLLSIEETIDKNTQWVVFEPNEPSLWARLKRDLSAYLTIVWRSGALFGATAAEAFFVKIDTENNPPEQRDAGMLVIDVGVAPVKPAEFVVFRITQITPKK